METHCHKIKQTNLKILPGERCVSKLSLSPGFLFKGGTMQIGKLIFIFLLLFAVGCEGKKGDTGSVGAQGEKGDTGEGASAATYEGIITSELVIIPIDELKADTLPIVSIYCSPVGTGEWIEIPVYNASGNGNVVASIFYGKVEIYYAYSNGFSRYYIIIASYPQSPKLSAKGRFDYFRF